ncbi:MAG: DNA polymerase III subunit gamma/tau [Bacillota bacterium]
MPGEKMEYQTLYRRWRPRGFADFVGQNHVVTTLSNAITAGRIAHAYLFTGPRGTGKTSAAKIFAKALNCENLKGSEPCNQCSSCVRINEGIFMDVLEIDAASTRGIDEIRELREKVKFAPAEGRYKIYIIDEVHMLTAEAFNALLKTLEEPPQSVVFILATTEAHKIPLTILSRCQRFDFKRFTNREITGRLIQILQAEKVKFSEPALDLIAEHSEGGMRDAVSLLEQVLAHSREQIEESDVRAILGLITEEEILRIAQAVKERDTGRALAILNGICMDGKDLFQFGRSLVEYYRNLLLKTMAGQEPASYNTGELVKIIETIAAATSEVKKSFQGSLPLELAFIKLTVAPAVSDDLAARVARLEALVRENPIERQPAPGNTVILKEVHPKTPAAGSKEPAPAVTNTAVNVEKNGGAYDWDLFLEAVKKKKRTLAALIQEGKPLTFNQTELVIGIPANLKFHLDNLSLPQNKQLLENILTELTGAEIRVNCVPLSEKQPEKGPQAKLVEPEALTKAVQMFGGVVRPLTKEEK